MSTPATQGCTGPKRHSQVKNTLPDKVLVMSLVLSVAAAWSWVLGARFCWGFLFFLYTLLGLCHLKKLFSARKTLNPPPPSKQGTHVLLLFLFFSIRGGDLGQSKLQGSMFFACLSVFCPSLAYCKYQSKFFQVVWISPHLYDRPWQCAGKPLPVLPRNAAWVGNVHPIISKAVFYQTPSAYVYLYNSPRVFWHCSH